MRLTTRSAEASADLIRDRLRALLAEPAPPAGWVPDDELGLAPLDGEDEIRRSGEVTGGAAPLRTGDSRQDGGERRDRLPEGIGRHRAPGTAARLDPGRRGAWSLWLAGAIGAVVLVCWTWLGRPQVHEIPPSAAPGVASAGTSPRTPPVGAAAGTSSTVVVSVTGQVARPGLVSLRSGARVADAIDAAGGLLPGADAGGVNLAAVVADGQQLAVGVPAAPSVAPGSGDAPGAGERLDLNSASLAELDGLPGVGPVLAQRILEFRQRQGRFTSVEQLDDVPGIGPSLYSRLAEKVRV